MAVPTFTMRQLLEAGVHFGHNKNRWNPKMAEYIFGTRHNIHIIDLQQTVPMLYRALETLVKVSESGGRVLFVGTKRQAGDKVKEAAKRCAQHYVNHRWLGGMLTNWQTISKSISRLKEIEGLLAKGDESGLTKKELLKMTRERDKLERAIGGVREMGGVPEVMFVIDTNREELAIKEANKIGIPVIAVLDTNCDPSGIDLPIPGNDDAMKAINLYLDLASDAVLEGIQLEMATSGKDAGTSVEPALEKLPAAKTPEAIPEEGKVKVEVKKKPASKAADPKLDKAAADDSKKSDASEEGASKEEKKIASA